VKLQQSTCSKAHLPTPSHIAHAHAPPTSMAPKRRGRDERAASIAEQALEALQTLMALFEQLLAFLLRHFAGQPLNLGGFPGFGGGGGSGGGGNPPGNGGCGFGTTKVVNFG